MSPPSLRSGTSRQAAVARARAGRGRQEGAAGKARRARDRWIAGMAIPIMRHLGVEVVTGEQRDGTVLVEKVRGLINDSDALIGFLTRRDEPNADGEYDTHDWVIGEVASAVTSGLERV